MSKLIKSIFKILLIVVLFALIGMTTETPRKVTLVESVFSNIIDFPQQLYVRAKAYVTSDNGFFVNVEELQAENEELKKRVAELEAQVINHDELLATVSTLRTHLNLAEKYPDYNLVVADIISDSATSWEATYVVNKGEAQGVKAGMTVIATNGLVGYVESVTKNTSKIISVLDAGNAVSARVSRTRDEIVCKGSVSSTEDQELKIVNIPIGTTLIENDKIETSGIGGIYPKGISIGNVVEVVNKKNPLENEALIKTSVDFNTLETVGIIVLEDEIG